MTSIFLYMIPQELRTRIQSNSTNERENDLIKLYTKSKGRYLHQKYVKFNHKPKDKCLYTVFKKCYVQQLAEQKKSKAKNKGKCEELTTEQASSSKPVDTIFTSKKDLNSDMYWRHKQIECLKRFADAKRREMMKNINTPEQGAQANDAKKSPNTIQIDPKKLETKSNVTMSNRGQTTIYFKPRPRLWEPLNKKQTDSKKFKIKSNLSMKPTEPKPKTTIYFKPWSKLMERNKKQTDSKKLETEPENTKHTTIYFERPRTDSKIESKCVKQTEAIQIRFKPSDRSNIQLTERAQSKLSTKPTEAVKKQTRQRGAEGSSANLRRLDTQSTMCTKQAEANTKLRKARSECSYSKHTNSKRLDILSIVHMKQAETKHSTKPMRIDAQVEASTRHIEPRQERTESSNTKLDLKRIDLLSIFDMKQAEGSTRPESSSPKQDHSNRLKSQSFKNLKLADTTQSAPGQQESSKTKDAKKLDFLSIVHMKQAEASTKHNESSNTTTDSKKLGSSNTKHILYVPRQRPDCCNTRQGDSSQESKCIVFLKRADASSKYNVQGISESSNTKQGSTRRLDEQCTVCLNHAQSSKRPQMHDVPKGPSESSKHAMRLDTKSIGNLKAGATTKLMQEKSEISNTKSIERMEYTTLKQKPWRPESFDLIHPVQIESTARQTEANTIHAVKPRQRKSVIDSVIETQTSVDVNPSESSLKSTQMKKQWEGSKRHETLVDKNNDDYRIPSGHPLLKKSSTQQEYLQMQKDMFGCIVPYTAFINLLNTFKSRAGGDEGRPRYIVPKPTTLYNRSVGLLYPNSEISYILKHANDSKGLPNVHKACDPQIEMDEMHGHYPQLNPKDHSSKTVKKVKKTRSKAKRHARKSTSSRSQKIDKKNTRRAPKTKKIPFCLRMRNRIRNAWDSFISSYIC